MYSESGRNTLRSQLLEQARQDAQIRAAAITGSAAGGREDAWSDIDLAFAVDESAGVDAVLQRWSAWMYEQHGALDHLDVAAGSWIYRVFLLPDTLQVDLAFAPERDFQPLGPDFALVFGQAGEPGEFPPQPRASIAGWAWLYALHARSAIARGRLWQAEYMISGLRDQVLALAALRHNLAPAHAKLAHMLPESVTRALEPALVRSLDPDELRRAFAAALDALSGELHQADPTLAARLKDAVRQLAIVPR